MWTTTAPNYRDGNTCKFCSHRKPDDNWDDLLECWEDASTCIIHTAISDDEPTHQLKIVLTGVCDDYKPLPIGPCGERCNNINEETCRDCNI